MNIDYKIVDSILEAISPLPHHFGACISNNGGEQPPFDYEEILDRAKIIDPQIEIRFGISKLVIISTLLPYHVIKIPFNGMYEEEYDDDSDSMVPIWYDFIGSAAVHDFSDYCLYEYEEYHSLKKQRLQCFVAKTIFYRTFEDKRIFLQERAVCLDDIDSCSTINVIPKESNSMKIAKQLLKERKAKAVTTEWLAACIQWYGLKTVMKFFKYCLTENYHLLHDCHGGNYGYRLNGTPCLLDFSDFSD